MTSKTIIINDGCYRYPVLRADVEASGQTEESLRAMTGDEYSAWCSSGLVPVMEGLDVGTQECIDRCADLEEEGADVWRVG